MAHGWASCLRRLTCSTRLSFSFSVRVFIACGGVQYMACIGVWCGFSMVGVVSIGVRCSIWSLLLSKIVDEHCCWFSVSTLDSSELGWPLGCITDELV